MTRPMSCSSLGRRKCLRINKVSVYLSIATDFPEQEDKDDSDTQELENEQSGVTDKPVLTEGVIVSGNYI